MSAASRASVTPLLAMATELSVTDEKVKPTAGSEPLISAPNAWLAVSAATDPARTAMTIAFRIIVDLELFMIPSSKKLCV